MSLVVEEIEVREMTAEEFLALPEDGVSRELIRGVLRERPMTVRNRFHAVATVNLSFLLKLWLKGRPEPRGQIVGGDAGFWLRGTKESVVGTKESVVGIDVAYASAELVAASGPKHRVFHGPPVLAVEIISPSDTHEDIVEKVASYLEVGTLVWLVDVDHHLPPRPDRRASRRGSRIDRRAAIARFSGDRGGYLRGLTPGSDRYVRFSSTPAASSSSASPDTTSRPASPRRTAPPPPSGPGPSPPP